MEQKTIEQIQNEASAYKQRLDTIQNFVYQNSRAIQDQLNATGEYKDASGFVIKKIPNNNNTGYTFFDPQTNTTKDFNYVYHGTTGRGFADEVAKKLIQDKEVTARADVAEIKFNEYLQQPSSHSFDANEHPLLSQIGPVAFLLTNQKELDARLGDIFRAGRSVTLPGGFVLESKLSGATHYGAPNPSITLKSPTGESLGESALYTSQSNGFNQVIERAIQEEVYKYNKKVATEQTFSNIPKLKSVADGLISAYNQVLRVGDAKSIDNLRSYIDRNFTARNLGVSSATQANQLQQFVLENLHSPYLNNITTEKATNYDKGAVSGVRAVSSSSNPIHQFWDDISAVAKRKENEKIASKYSNEVNSLEDLAKGGTFAEVTPDGRLVQQTIPAYTNLKKVPQYKYQIHGAWFVGPKVPNGADKASVQQVGHDYVVRDKNGRERSLFENTAISSDIKSFKINNLPDDYVSYLQTKAEVNPSALTSDPALQKASSLWGGYKDSSIAKIDPNKPMELSAIQAIQERQKLANTLSSGLNNILTGEGKTMRFGNVVLSSSLKDPSNPNIYKLELKDLNGNVIQSASGDRGSLVRRNESFRQEWPGAVQSNVSSPAQQGLNDWQKRIGEGYMKGNAGWYDAQSEHHKATKSDPVFTSLRNIIQSASTIRKAIENSIIIDDGDLLVAELPHGYSIVRDVAYLGNAGWDRYTLIDPSGTPIASGRNTSDSKGFAISMVGGLSRSLGYDPSITTGTWQGSSSYDNEKRSASNYAKELAASDPLNPSYQAYLTNPQSHDEIIDKYRALKDSGQFTGTLKEFENKRFEDPTWDPEAGPARNYGTFINAAGKQVVATSPEMLKNFQVLGFPKVADGTTELTPDERALVDSAFAEKKAQLDAALASGGIDQKTYDSLVGTRVDLQMIADGKATDMNTASILANIETGTITKEQGEAALAGKEGEWMDQNIHSAIQLKDGVDANTAQQLQNLSIKPVDQWTSADLALWTNNAETPVPTKEVQDQIITTKNAYLGITQEPSVPQIDFKDGVTEEQKNQLYDLYKKPADQWTDQDKATWNTLTNNQAFPWTSIAQQTASVSPPQLLPDGNYVDSSGQYYTKGVDGAYIKTEPPEEPIHTGEALRDMLASRYNYTTPSIQDFKSGFIESSAQQGQSPQYSAAGFGKKEAVNTSTFVPTRSLTSPDIGEQDARAQITSKASRNLGSQIDSGLDSNIRY